MADHPYFVLNFLMRHPSPTPFGRFLFRRAPLLAICTAAIAMPAIAPAESLSFSSVTTVVTLLTGDGGGGAGSVHIVHHVSLAACAHQRKRCGTIIFAYPSALWPSSETSRR